MKNRSLKPKASFIRGFFVTLYSRNNFHMSLPITYRDANTGHIITVHHDPAFALQIDVPASTTQWKTETTDPVHGTLQTDWVGNIPKPKK